MYKKGQFVCFVHPEYPELEGVTKVMEVIGDRGLAVKIQFEDGSKFNVATRLLRHATKEEIEWFNVHENKDVSIDE